MKQQHSEQLNFEKVWLMFQEIKQSFQETDRRFQETKEMLERESRISDRKLRKLESLFTGQWGKLVESLVEGKLVELLKEKMISSTIGV